MRELDPRHYRAILESLPNGIAVLDAERRIVFWNDGAERITGYLRQQVLGRECPETLLLPRDSTPLEMCPSDGLVPQVLRDGRAREADLFLCHRDGQRVPVRARVVPIRDELGAIVAAVESFDERYPALELPLHPHAQTVENHKDRLTGVSDHDSLLTYLEACLEDFAEDETPFGVLSLALEGFHELQQARGRPAAARVLQAVAETLSKNLPPGGIVGRWAEDRFVVILTDCPAAALARRAAILQQVVPGAAISWWGDRRALTLSLGGTTARPGDTAESLLNRAERARRTGVQTGNVVEIR